MTLTNPGTISTAYSVPRLMPGQGVIVGVGAITYSPGFTETDPQMLADMGVSKILTLTSTYDHRIIQGTESREFLKKIEALLQGEEEFYDEIFGVLGLRTELVRHSQDMHRGGANSNLPC